MPGKITTQMSQRSLLTCLFAVSCGAPPPPAPPLPLDQTAPAGAVDPLSASALFEDVQRLCADDLEGRGSYQSGGVRAAAFMEDALRRAGLEVVRQPIMRGAETVVGIKRAGKQAVIVSAHYDHLGVDEAGTVFLGADDNASGAAIILGLARANESAELEHSVLFVAFGAEEDALAGSAVYIHAPLWPLEDTVAVINFDMVGRNFFEAGANQPKAAAVIGLDEIPDARKVAGRAADAAGLKIIAAPARLLELFGFENRTDDWWFRRQNIPAIHFSTGLHADYHQPSDTPDKIMPAQMERVARTANALLQFLANRGAATTPRTTADDREERHRRSIF